MSNEKQRENRPSSSSDFNVHVEGIGNFIFARRTMRDEMRIAAEYSRFTEGVPQPTPFLDSVAGWISTLNVLTVEMPFDWDPETMDPFDDDTHAKILKVYGALRAKEGSFRAPPGTPSQNSGPGNGETPELLVSSPVPPSAD